jgi:hypothetical protein
MFTVVFCALVMAAWIAIGGSDLGPRTQQPPRY